MKIENYLLDNVEEIIDQILYTFEELNLKKELSIMIEELILKLVKKIVN